jgi:hypothetical protein
VRDGDEREARVRVDQAVKSGWARLPSNAVFCSAE